MTKTIIKVHPSDFFFFLKNHKNDVKFHCGDGPVLQEKVVDSLESLAFVFQHVCRFGSPEPRLLTSTEVSEARRALSSRSLGAESSGHVSNRLARILDADPATLPNPGPAADPRLGPEAGAFVIEETNRTKYARGPPHPASASLWGAAETHTHAAI